MAPGVSAELHRIDRRTVRLALRDARGPLTHAAVHAGLANDGQLLDALIEALLQAPLSAAFWECAPTRGAADQPWQCVLVDAPALARLRADPAAFADHLHDGEDTPEVRTFDNLGGDAVLVAPCRDAGLDAPHLLAFLRSAEPLQAHALWQAVGRAALAWRAERPDPLWLSTSGLGVPWLHVRLDVRPKYYTHGPFRRNP